MSPSRHPGTTSGVLPHRTPVRFQLSNVPRCLPQTVTPRRNLPPRLFQGTIDRAPKRERPRSRACLGTKEGHPVRDAPSIVPWVKSRTVLAPVYRVMGSQGRRLRSLWGGVSRWRPRTRRARRSRVPRSRYQPAPAGASSSPRTAAKPLAAPSVSCRSWSTDRPPWRPLPV